MKQKRYGRLSRVLSIALAASLLLAALPLGLAASAEESDGLTILSAVGSSNGDRYVYRKTGGRFNPTEAKLVQYPAMQEYSGYSGTFAVPSLVSEDILGIPTFYTVTEIGGREGVNPGALENTQLTAVSLPSTVTTVGSYALASASISDVTFPTSILNLDAAAFTGVTLSKLTLDVVNETTLLSENSYSTSVRAPILLPRSVTDLTVNAPLTVSGTVAVPGAVNLASKLTVEGGGSLSLNGTVSGAANGSIEVKNNGTLTLNTSMTSFTGQIRLSGAGSKLVNQTGSQVRFVNAQGVTVVAESGETANGAQGSTIPDTPSGGISTRPKISTTYGGTVAVQEKGRVVLISAFEGYHVEDVVINGLSMGPITRYEFTVASNQNTVEVSFAHGQASEGPDVPNINPISQFTDVDPNGWYADAISFMVRNKIFYGVSKTEFAPSDQTTRAMFVTLLYRLEDFDEMYSLPCKSPAPLTDVRHNSWYEDAAKWAAGTGVSTVSGTEFQPSRIITREEIGVCLYNFTKALGGNVEADEGILDSYSDKDKISPEAREAMAWAVTNGYLTGRSGGLLEPFSDAMRSEIAEILMRYLTSNDNSAAE